MSKTAGKKASPGSSQNKTKGSPKKSRDRTDSVAHLQKVETFCQAIVAGKSQSDALREAHPPARKWKPEVVHNKAYEFAQRGDVQVRLEELAKQQFSRYEQDIGAIMERIRGIVMADLRKLFGPDGKLLPLDTLPPDALAAVTSIEVDAQGQVRTKLLSCADRLKAIELLGKFYKIWTEKHDINFEKPIVQIQGMLITDDMDPVEASRLYRDLARRT